MLRDKMQLREADKRIRESAQLQLYKNDKNYRADRLIASWSKVPEIGVGLKDLPLQEARNVAINLDRQCNFMQNLRESQLATALNDFTPENMLRLVRLAMPNIIRNKVFTEFALETTKDSIKYIRPFFSRTARGNALNDKDPGFNPKSGETDPDAIDPWGYSKGGDFNGDDFRKALYEDTRDRPNQELANAIVSSVASGTYAPVTFTGGTTPETVTANIFFKAIGTALTGISDEAIFESGKWGINGEAYVDGYTYLYYGVPGQSTAQIEQQVVAIQEKSTGRFYAAPGFTVTLGAAPQVRDKFIVPYPNKAANDPNGIQDGVDLTAATGGLLPHSAVTTTATPGVLTVTITTDETIDLPAGAILFAFGRYNSESDFEGNYLGEVEIRMDEYTFKPSPTAIGVSWSQLTEITLNTSFNISAEEYLVSYASQEIRSALDYRAIRLAYAVAKTNAKTNPNYYYHFDAAYSTSTGTTTGTKDGYVANAQTFVSAIDAIGDVIYDEINRGGVSRLVGGPSACAYLHLNAGYSPKGKGGQTGSHQFGELDGLPVFKVPSAIIPSSEFLTVWKNDQVENDVAIAFGTLIPFFSTGIIQRKNFYKEAGLATYGDWAVLNRRYMAIIKLDNLKDNNTLQGASISKPLVTSQS